MSKRICVYHSSCADGFAAAWVVWRFFDCANYPDAIEFWPAKYGDQAPDCTGKEIYIVDFSYPLETMQEIAKTAKLVVLLDHHKTAIEALGSWRADTRVIDGKLDASKAGCQLTWEWFFQKKPMPLLLEFIADRDLWEFKHGDESKWAHAALTSYPYDFLTWNHLIEKVSARSLCKEGESIRRSQMKNIYELIGAHRFLGEIDGYTVPMLNCPFMWASDAGNILCAGWSFSATYTVDFDQAIFSLRSDADGVDVSEIAERFGGGGHKNAAGFKIPLDKFTLPGGIKS